MKNISFLFAIALGAMVIFSSSTCSKKAVKEKEAKILELSNYSKAYFASGCFWCVEAIYESVEGVVEVISGYSGGNADDANYRDVSNGITDHAEAVEIYYDSTKVDYKTLLVVFFGSHDPTTLNRQGPDAGRQYRSAIFYQNEDEKLAAENYINVLIESKAFKGDITTELTPLTAFYVAEEYHQDYEKKNPGNPYVKAVSIPRLKKFQSKYPELLKKGNH
jgi:peptide-methionine (S)-S-oxide reductase